MHAGDFSDRIFTEVREHTHTKKLHFAEMQRMKCNATLRLMTSPDY